MVTGFGEGAAFAFLGGDAGFFGAVVDVRRADEWAAGHLENATFCPSLHETRDTAALSACRSCPIAVYCRSGLVSHREGS